MSQQPYITSWHSPFNHPLPSAPYPCNHVSSYIIAFQLLTGVWPLPPNMPNLIHVFPKRQRDACLVKGRGKKTCNVKATKRDASVFFCCHNANAASIFSETYTVFYGDVNSRVTGHGLKTRGKERRRLRTDITEVQQRQESVWVCVTLPASQFASECVWSPLNSRTFCNPNVRRRGEKTPKIPWVINLPLPLPGCPAG